MNTLSNAINEVSKTKYTENGAKAYKALSNPVMTLFGQVGALRTRSEQEICNMFEAAFNYDRVLTTHMIFYAGDIRGGLGERRTFNIALNWLARNHSQIAIDNIKLIPEFNRWDAIYSLVDTPAESAMWQVVKTQFIDDLTAMRSNKPVSLMAKWLKSANTSSKKSCELGKKTAAALGLTLRDYRHGLSALREYIKVTEVKMSANKWNQIDYEGVPSYAMKNYRKAFERHDESRWAKYVESLTRGEAKVNSATLFPYDLVKSYLTTNGWGLNIKSTKDPIIEAQWKALPDYLNGNDANVMTMVDISGSMYGDPICSSLGLGIYFAQHNHGAFRNQFMTFSSNPHFVTLTEGCTLLQALKESKTDAGYSTNLEAAFNLLLRTAVNNRVPAKDMPKALIIISDSEIDQYRNQHSVDFMTAMEMKYANAGYDLPVLIFFQVEARQSTFLTLRPDALFISGNSASSFKALCDNIGKTGWELCVNTLMAKRYECIVVR